MKFFIAGTLAITIVAAVLAAIPSAAQTAPTGGAPAKPSAGEDSKPSGKVIFSRSEDENGPSTASSEDVVKPAGQIVSEPSLEDADRSVVTFTGLDLDVRLYSATHQIAVRGCRDGAQRRQNSAYARSTANLLFAQLGANSRRGQRRCLSGSHAQLRRRSHGPIA